MALRCRPRKLVNIYFLIIAGASVWFIINFVCPVDTGKDVSKLMQTLKNSLDAKTKEVGELRQKLSQMSATKSDDFQPKLDKFEKDLPVIYLITPTYARSEQKAELTRLCYTFLHVKNLHWIVIEDSDKKTDLVKRFLKRCGVSFTHINAATPKEYKMDLSDPNWLKPRGVLQRNAGLDWIRENVPRTKRGVLYFADDDNTYDLRIFEEMRDTKKISTWPVGLVGYLRYESPIVSANKVVGWFTYWKSERTFAMDMAGFAINIKLLFSHPDAQFRFDVPRGYQETTLLSNLGLSRDDLEIKANNCTEVLVWHTRTEKSKLKNEEKMKKLHGVGSDLTIEV